MQDLLEERKTIRTEEEKDKAWTDAADMVKTYSDEMVERWNRVIDTYLVFVCNASQYCCKYLTLEHRIGGVVLGDPHGV